MSYLVVFIGSGIGGALRHGMNTLAARLFGLDFPAGTFSVNVIGSLLMGAMAGYFAFKGQASQDVRLFLATGLLGGFTTFSAFSLDTVLLYERGRWALAFAYAAVSVVVAIAALVAGLLLMRRIL
jgi:CrcB protein